MAKQPDDRAALYREKAKEAHTMAEGIGGTSARAIVLKVAASWDRLARAEEERKKPESN